MYVLLLILAFAGPLGAQQAPFPAAESAPAGANPLAELKDEVKRVLADARLPFTEEQERAIILMMEDRLRASEDLFGDLMNFQAGPTRGEEADHLRSAIEWMREEFLKRLQDYLTPEQLASWNAYSATASTPKPLSNDDTRPPARPRAQTQYV